MPKLALDRAAISKIAQGVPQTISALEKAFGDVAGFPSTIEEANALAGQALAAAQSALSMLTVLADELAQLDGMPAPMPLVDPDDTAPRVHLGTMSVQDADAVEITGGGVDNTIIGATTAAEGNFTTLTASGQFTSTVAVGTPPLVVTSTDLVDNLYVARAAHADSADLGEPTTYPANATDLPSALALVNALKAAATLKGL
jgi:hypothetical protein